MAQANILRVSPQFKTFALSFKYKPEICLLIQIKHIATVNLAFGYNVMDCLGGWDSELNVMVNSSILKVRASSVSITTRHSPACQFCI